MKPLLITFLMCFTPYYVTHQQGVKCPHDNHFTQRTVEDSETLFYGGFHQKFDISNYSPYLARCGKCNFLGTEDDFKKNYSKEEMDYILKVSNQHAHQKLDNNAAIYRVVIEMKKELNHPKIEIAEVMLAELFFELDPEKRKDKIPELLGYLEHIELEDGSYQDKYHSNLSYSISQYKQEVSGE
ncbi:hypothetical protein KMW28_17755 [Flammeovirga yaeyamensis]|uniref:Uncharacterized protein n=1 Tax=Flammeovirga yaeyamensis TaxID=367791 RepID=A0AAX1N6I9_9BACT|nr:hypothetical protein [Flammeovirga yaeyamensis]MBB3698131.1 hypothetical protein [Flammeovirga yaeyamensis]NMF34510.1 hypothetical protein [Flammeovirga yaeyamensis]QWG01488.1 hypothetical protein KMW28_17755 [Flammeovirga yaeyamensis]